MSSPPDTIENHNRGDDRDNAASHDAVDDVGGDGGGVVVGDVREAGRSGCRARATSAGVGGGGGAAATPESVGDSAAMNETVSVLIRKDFALLYEVFLFHRIGSPSVRSLWWMRPRSLQFQN